MYRTLLDYFAPTGIEQLRQGRSIVVLPGENRPESVTFNVYSRQFPEVTATQKQRLANKYSQRKAEASTNAQTIINTEQEARVQYPSRERLPFGYIDQRLLHPELDAYNPTGLTCDQLQAVYPHRLQALRDGYVLLNNFSGVMVPKELLTDPTVSVPGFSATVDYVGVPELRWAYDTYLAIQSEYDIRFVETPFSFVDGFLEPLKLGGGFSVMFKSHTS